MNSFDHSLKFLVGHQPADFIAFGMGGAVQVRGALGGALPARNRDVDDLFLIVWQGREWVLHLEYHRRHQSQEELALDVVEAQARLRRREGRPVLTQVWDLYGERGGRLLEDRVVPFGGAPGGAASQCAYRRVNLRALRAQSLLLEAPPALWPLVPLTADGARVEAVRAARDAIEGRSDVTGQVKADHLAVLLFMAAAEGLAMDVLRAYIPKEKMMESELYREIFEEGAAEGEARGEARGKAEGKADTLIRILLRRFHFVDDLLSQRVRAETRIEVLDAWLDEAVLTQDEAGLGTLVEHIKRTPLPPAAPRR